MDVRSSMLQTRVCWFQLASIPLIWIGYVSILVAEPQFTPQFLSAISTIPFTTPWIHQKYMLPEMYFEKRSIYSFLSALVNHIPLEHPLFAIDYGMVVLTTSWVSRNERLRSLVELIVVPALYQVFFRRILHLSQINPVLFLPDRTALGHPPVHRSRQVLNPVNHLL